jgi:hypothetical protein
MKPSNLFRTGITPVGLVATAMLALAGNLALANTNPAETTYSWSAELIALDRDAGTMTVQARLVTEADAAALASLRSGERATLVWSGMNWAAGVRSVTRGTPAETDRLVLPIEFVSAEGDGRYVRFKVPVPSVDAARIASLAPGGWVTAISPRRLTSFEEAVAAVRPYTDVG